MKKYTYDEERASFVVRFFENLSPLLPWQRKIVETVYGTVDRHGKRQHRFVHSAHLLRRQALHLTLRAQAGVDMADALDELRSIE